MRRQEWQAFATTRTGHACLRLYTLLCVVGLTRPRAHIIMLRSENLSTGNGGLVTVESESNTLPPMGPPIGHWNASPILF